jgi:hypothetical protein
MPVFPPVPPDRGQRGVAVDDVDALIRHVELFATIWP